MLDTRNDGGGGTTTTTTKPTTDTQTQTWSSTRPEGVSPLAPAAPAPAPTALPVAPAPSPKPGTVEVATPSQPVETALPVAEQPYVPYAPPSAPTEQGSTSGRVVDWANSSPDAFIAYDPNNPQDRVSVSVSDLPEERKDMYLADYRVESTSPWRQVEREQEAKEAANRIVFPTHDVTPVEKDVRSVMWTYDVNGKPTNIESAVLQESSPIVDTPYSDKYMPVITSTGMVAGNLVFDPVDMKFHSKYSLGGKTVSARSLYDEYYYWDTSAKSMSGEGVLDYGAKQPTYKTYDVDNAMDTAYTQIVGGKSATPEPVTDTDAKKEPWRLSTELYKASDKADKYIAGNSVLGSTWLIGDIARSVTSWPLATMGLVTETSEKAAPSMMGHYAVPFDLANGNYAAAGAKEAAATKGMSRANYDAASIMAIGAVTSFKEDPARAAYDFIGIPLLMGGAGKLASGVTGVRTGPSIKALATDKTTGTPLSGVGFDLQKAAPTVSELLADRSSKPPTIAPVTDYAVTTKTAKSVESMIKSKTSTGSPPIKTPTDVTTNNLINMYKRPVTTATSKTVIDFYKNQKWSNPTSKTTIPTTTKKTYNPSSSLNTLYEAEKTIREQAKTKTTYKLPETTPEENMFSSLQTFLDDKKGSTTLEIMERPKTKPVKTKMELDVTHEVDYRGIVNQRGKLTSKRTVRTRTAMEAEARDTAAFKRYLNERAAKMTEARQRAPKLKTGTAVLPFTIGASIQRDRTDAFNIDDTTQDTGQDSVQDNEAAVKQITNTLTGTKQGSKQTTDQVSDSMTKVGAAMMMGGMPRTRTTDRLPVLRLPGGSGGSGRSYGPKIGNIRNVYANQISGFDPFEMRAKRRRHK